MKRGTSSTWILIALWTIAVVISGGTYWIINAQSTVAEDLSNQVKNVETAVMDGNWSQADLKIRQVRTRWEQIEKVWALYTDHQELDQIMDLLVQAEARITQHSLDALVPLRRARQRITALPDRDRLLLENLL